jgi:hypothetical protein
VILEQVKPMPADEEDPPTNYVTAREEMIARAPHKTDDKPNAEFQINSRKVFDALTLVMRETAACKVMVARCGTVWRMSPNTGHEYLLISDQMLWFGNQMDHLLINPNQIHEYGIPMYDDPFSQSQFGINCNDDFIPFIIMGTIVCFETCVLMDWETHNLPIIMLLGEDYDPVNVGLGNG